MVEEFRLFSRSKRKYFLRCWSYVEVGIISCSWTAVAIYIWRYQQSKDLGERFQQTRGFVYINLQLSTYVNDLFTFLLALCCFFGTIRCLRLGQYNRRLALFSRTLQLAVKELLSFSLMFSIVVVAFLCLFYFLFNSKLHSCATFFQTTQMLSQMALMKFDATELAGSATYFVFEMDRPEESPAVWVCLRSVRFHIPTTLSGQCSALFPISWASFFQFIHSSRGLRLSKYVSLDHQRECQTGETDHRRRSRRNLCLHLEEIHSMDGTEQTHGDGTLSRTR